MHANAVNDLIGSDCPQSESLDAKPRRKRVKQAPQTKKILLVVERSENSPKPCRTVRWLQDSVREFQELEANTVLGIAELRWKVVGPGEGCTLCQSAARIKKWKLDGVGAAQHWLEYMIVQVGWVLPRLYVHGLEQETLQDCTLGSDFDQVLKVYEPVARALRHELTSSVLAVPLAGRSRMTGGLATFPTFSEC